MNRYILAIIALIALTGTLRAHGRRCAGCQSCGAYVVVEVRAGPAVIGHPSLNPAQPVEPPELTQRFVPIDPATGLPRVERIGAPMTMAAPVVVVQVQCERRRLFQRSSDCGGCGRTVRVGIRRRVSNRGDCRASRCQGDSSRSGAALDSAGRAQVFRRGDGQQQTYLADSRGHGGDDSGDDNSHVGVVIISSSPKAGDS